MKEVRRVGDGADSNSRRQMTLQCTPGEEKEAGLSSSVDW